MSTVLIDIAAPLAVLIILKIAVRYRARMAISLFLLGPLAGAIALLVVRQFNEARPELWRILAGLPIFYFFALALFGLWVTVSGVIAWWFLSRFAKVKDLSAGWGIGFAAVIGLLIGPLLAVGLWALVTSDPQWRQERMTKILTNNEALRNVICQGLLGGVVCAEIVIGYIRRGRTA